MADTVRAAVYLQVAPETRHWLDENHPEFISGAKVVNATQGRSKKPISGTVEVKLTVELPKAAFLPLRPEAVVVVPETLTTPHPISVQAVDANDAEH